jgi:hypothetical protein
MKDLWTKAALGAVALVCANVANAYVIDFESVSTAGAPFAPLLADGQYVTQGAYNIYGQDGSNTTTTPDGSLVAALSNGATAASCLDGKCPVGDATNYMSAYNNGIVSVQSNTATNFTLSSFSAAFLPPAGVTLPATQVAYLAVEGDRSDGTYALALYTLLGPNATSGLTTFANFTAAAPTTYNGGTGTLLTGDFSALFFYAYYCSGGSCNRFTSDKGQFAIDNINVSAVPEPADWALMTAGLVTVAAVIRRRRAV